MKESGLPETRAHKREPVTLPIAYSFTHGQTGSPETLNAVKHGISLDLSESGICIYVPDHLSEGMLLNVYANDVWEGARTGTVRWCKRITEELFRVGIKLLAGPSLAADPLQS